MKIAEATDAHIPQMLGLWTEFFDYHRQIDPYFTRSDDALAHIERRFREKMRDPDGLVLVALEGDQVIGYSLSWVADNSPFMKERKHGFISDLAVTSGHRRRGIGTQLLEGTLAWFESRGVRRIALFVIAGNEMSLAFWEKHGFRPAMLSLERILDIDAAGESPSDAG